MLEINPDTMTLQECCDALADFKGWVKRRVSPLRYNQVEAWFHNGDLENEPCHHPVQPTLDSIAASLPEGYIWCVVQWYKRDDVEAWCHRIGDCNNDSMIGMRADEEPLARARCAVKCWMQVNNNAA